MAALTADRELKTREGRAAIPPIVAGKTIYRGAIVAMLISGNDKKNVRCGDQSLLREA